MIGQHTGGGDQEGIRQEAGEGEQRYQGGRLGQAVGEGTDGNTNVAADMNARIRRAAGRITS